jgi:hypothetical protein
MRRVPGKQQMGRREEVLPSFEAAELPLSPARKCSGASGPLAESLSPQEDMNENVRGHGHRGCPSRGG